MNVVGISLEPWSDADLPLLEQLLGDPAMMEHLGGPESPEQIRQRHQRYLRLPETDHMFKIVLREDAAPVGSVGYWKKLWHDQPVYEMGWQVLPAYHGRGIATKAGEAVIAQARSDHRYQFMHAFPSVSNPASNAICRKLGFTWIEECEVEYPPGNFMTINDWRLELYQK